MSLALGCKTSNTTDTATPGTTPTDTADGGTTPGDGSGPQVRTQTSTTSANKLGTGPRVKASKLVAKKAPAGENGTKTTNPPVENPDPVQITGFFPQVAPVGTLIEIYGTNFHPNQRRNQVRIGGTRMLVHKAFEDRLVVKVNAAVSGPIEVVKGKVFKGRDDAEIAKTTASFTGVAAGGGFGQPRRDPAHGLLGTVYDIGQASTEIPSFADIGAPVGYVVVEDLDIAPGEHPALDLGVKKLSTNYGVHFQGSLNITEAGEYEFCLNAGDAALLYLDQQVIVDADGAGESREVCEKLAVEPGEYGLDLLWYQNDGEMGLTMSWSKDGGAKTPIPATNLFPPDVAGLAAQVESGG